MRRRMRLYAERAAERATGAPADDLPGRPALRLEAPGRRPAAEGGRWGLVLGGGGILGAAWLVGALDALEQRHGLDARDAELILGTSAGSVVGALLAAGMSVGEQRAQQEGGRRREGGILKDVTLDVDRIGGAHRPPLPRMRPAGTAMLRNNRGSLRRLPVTTVLAGLAPAGRGTLAGVRELIEAVTPAGTWPEHPGYRAVALDYTTGRRTVFGAPTAPPAGLSDAVLASCAIPGWFEPVEIGGRTYVDGGTWSSTNADLAAGAGLDELFVLAPMASVRYDTPTDWRARVERRIRIAATRRCLAEADAVRAAGTTVTFLGPGPAELELIGHNLMAADRRVAVLESGFRTALTALAAPTRAHAGLPGAPGHDNASDLRTPLLDGRIEDTLAGIDADPRSAMVDIGAAPEPRADRG